MKRSPFKQKRQQAAPDDREQRLADRAARALAMLSIAPRAATIVNNSASIAFTYAVPIVKDAPVRSEALRRAIASLPCICCGIAGYSQHAHENGVDKAKGMKQDDRRGMPLCCDRPGLVGCHSRFDRYELVDGGREAHRLLGEHWAAETRATIINLGLWPKDLPLWKEES